MREKSMGYHRKGVWISLPIWKVLRPAVNQMPSTQNGARAGSSSIFNSQAWTSCGEGSGMPRTDGRRRVTVRFCPIKSGIAENGCSLERGFFATRPLCGTGPGASEVSHQKQHPTWFIGHLAGAGNDHARLTFTFPQANVENVWHRFQRCLIVDSTIRMDKFLLRIKFLQK